MEGERSEAPRSDEAQVLRIELTGAARREQARGALREILAECLGQRPEEIFLATDGGGKPRLADRPERLSFNLSHSGGVALVALAPGGVPIGVDVERLRPRRDLSRLAARQLPEADAAAVAAASDGEREAVFYAAWTRYEARAKCTGAGIFGPPPGDEIVAVPLEIGPGFAAAVAFDAEAIGSREPRLKIRSWP